LVLRRGDELAEPCERIGVGVRVPPVDRDAVRQLVDVAVGRARLPRPLALAALEARRRDLDPPGHEVGAHLDAGDVAVVDRRRHRAERRPGVETALQDHEPVVEAHERMAEVAAEAEADGLAVVHRAIELAAQPLRKDLGTADERSAKERPRLDRERRVLSAETRHPGRSEPERDSPPCPPRTRRAPAPGRTATPSGGRSGRAAAAGPSAARRAAPSRRTGRSAEAETEAEPEAAEEAEAAPGRGKATGSARGRAWASEPASGSATAQGSGSDPVRAWAAASAPAWASSRATASRRGRRPGPARSAAPQPPRAS